MGVSATCKRCGSVFEHRSGRTRKFCSSRCYWASQEGKPTPIPREKLGGGLGGPKLKGRRQTAEHVARRAESVKKALAAMLRPCRQCGVDFTPTVSSQRYCSGMCWNVAHRKPKARRFTIPIAEYRRLCEVQGNRCAICGVPSESNGRGDKLAVDHCHDTERVRGLLCHRCNTAIGLLRDDADLIQRAADYLHAYARE